MCVTIVYFLRFVESNYCIYCSLQLSVNSLPMLLRYMHHTDVNYFLTNVEHMFTQRRSQNDKALSGKHVCS